MARHKPAYPPALALAAALVLSAAARADNLIAVYQTAKRATQRQVRDAYLNVLSDISRIRALRQAVVSTTGALGATQNGFEVGTRTLVDVLNAQRAVGDARPPIFTKRAITTLSMVCG